ncbi:uncharacterized protein VTP21DRAFT_1497 [Calcarisporiella thermophila]|uniref:uncharacterized protein n=1 Tax=Calcarisporiella thermophila TaxID=911321 RepID=UPI003742E5ED
MLTDALETASHPEVIYLDEAPIQYQPIEQWAKGNRLWQARFHPVSTSTLVCFVGGKIPTKNKSGIVEGDRNLYFQSHNVLTSEMRMLVRDTHGIFCSSQTLKDSSQQNIVESSESLLKIANLYRQALFRGWRLAKDYTKVTMQSMHALWHICEIIFFASNRTAPVSEEIVDWLNLNYEIEKRDDIVNSSRPSEHPDFWRYVSRLTLRGYASASTNLLKLLLKENLSRTLENSVNNAIRLINAMPRRKAFAHDQDFLNRWRNWREDVKNIHFPHDHKHESLIRLMKMLSGDELIISKTCETWQEAFSSLLLFCHPTVDRTDLEHILDLTFHEHPINENSAVEQALVSFINNDAETGIKHCTKLSWWLSAHLVDLLVKARRVILNTEGYDVDVREYIILNYVETLMADPSLWRVSLDYLATCQVLGREYMSELVIRVPLESERKAQKILEACKTFELDEQYHVICRLVASQKYRNKSYGSAIAYNIKAKEFKRVSLIADQLLADFCKNNEFNFSDIIDSIGRDIACSDRLVFLQRYRELTELFNSKKSEEAAKLLVLLLSSNIAPKTFWASLLVDATVLLEGQKVVFDAEDTFELMRCLQEITSSHRKEEYYACLPSFGQHLDAAEKQLNVVRLALVRNLARSLMAYDETQYMGRE